MRAKIKSFDEDDVIKFGNIRINDITADSRNFLLDYGVEYRDQNQDLEEHLVSINNAYEKAKEDHYKIPRTIKEELDELQVIMNKQDIAYLRIITTE